jgi:hypothetical protein
MAMKEGVVRAPSEFSITRGEAPSITDTHEFVVPKSIPMMSPASAPREEEEAMAREAAPGAEEEARRRTANERRVAVSIVDGDD